jgi:methionyl-tRNA synthetase
MKKFYITTAIPYVNAAPHLGHALEFIQTDAIARFRRLKEDDVFFLTGADENAQKNVQAAEARNMVVHDLVDENTKKFTDVLHALNISFDDFIRTANKEKHWPGATKLWNLCFEKGDIYKKSYTGMYCVGCEAFLQEKDLVDGLCPEHKKAPEEVKEENYFFKLSHYQEQLAELIRTDKILIIPETKKNEVLSFIESGLEDFSISRSSNRMKGWGIPVPRDESQIIYVWFDALINYISGLGYGRSDDDLFNKFWPCDMHVIGKGITRFHAIYWPAMLLSAGVKLPKSIFVHGYITLDGGKMSKSLGTIVDPLDMINKYGIDTLRYYLLGHIPTFEDGDFIEKNLIEVINNELVATLGNLVNRTVTFIQRFTENTVIASPRPSDSDVAFWNKIKEKEAKVTELLEHVKLRDALHVIMDIARDGNGYFQASAPWKVIKENPEVAKTSLYYLANLCKDLAILIAPYLPDTSKNIFAQLNTHERKWSDLGSLNLQGILGEPKLLFAKVEEEQMQKLKDDFSGKKETSAAHPFEKFDLRVARIESVEQHPDAEKLFIESLDLGPLGKRTIVSGLKGHYTPEELVGKQIVIVANLKPAKLRGVMSEGMLLAAEAGDLVGVVLAPKAHPGDAVLLDGIVPKPAKEVAIKEFFSVSLRADKGVFVGENELLVHGKSLLIDKHVVGLVR